MDMTLLMVISGVCSIIFVRIKMPPILGYLAAGIILGPTMFPQLWVEQTTVMILSNIGIVLLMFWIGMEQSASKLRRVGSRLIFIVSLEMTLMVVVGYLAGMLLGLGTTASIFLGAVISGTSTAVVVGVLHGVGGITGEQATAIISITVFEDVGQVIILSLAAPLLAGDSPAMGSTINMVISLVIFFGLTIMLGIAAIPKLMDRLGDRYPSEIVFIVAVGMAFTMALISSSIGLSIAIGPFLIGLIVSVSQYNERIKSKVIPVKELFMAVFFISIGLQIDPRLILDNILLVLAIAAVFILGKTVAVALSTYLFGFKARDGFVIAVSLIAMGEFAFIIAKIALDAGLLTQDLYSSVIGAALITMVVLPLFAKVQKRTFDGLVNLLPRRALAALARIDTVKQAASSNNLLGRDRNVLSGLLARIFVDYLLIVLILLIFNLVSEVENAVVGLAGDLGLVPDAVLLFFMLLAISPAVASIFLYVRKISKVLTDRAMQTGRIAEGDRRNVYRMIIDLNEIAMLALVLVLIIPFVPTVMIGSPWVFLAVVAMAGLAAILLWDALRNSYVHFVNAVTGSGRSDRDKDGS